MSRRFESDYEQWKNMFDLHQAILETDKRMKIVQQNASFDKSMRLFWITFPCAMGIAVALLYLATRIGIRSEYTDSVRMSVWIVGVLGGFVLFCDLMVRLGMDKF